MVQVQPHDHLLFSLYRRAVLEGTAPSRDYLLSYHPDSASALEMLLTSSSVVRTCKCCPAEGNANAERLARFDQAVASLSDEHFQILSLRLLHGQTREQIAEKFGHSLSTIHRILQRIRATEGLQSLVD